MRIKLKGALKKILNFFGLTTLAEFRNLNFAHEKITKRLLYPVGHYYSPYPNIEAIHDKSGIAEDYILTGVNLETELQFKLLTVMKDYFAEINWPTKKTEDYNYYFENLYFSYSDAVFLHCIFRTFKPRKVIEVGSGYSSAAMSDINNNFFNSTIKLTFIEPYPEERLYPLVSKRDEVIVDFVQNVSIEKFKDLEKDDLLFIDTSHVSKYHSDVNHIFFNILPNLKSGVIIHIHDIFYPFEYPQEWIMQGRAWNEAYLLRAFLQYNSAFEILCFPSYLEREYKEWFEGNMPTCLKPHEVIDYGYGDTLMDTTGQSIYLRRK